MNLISRTITGIVLLLGGGLLIWFSPKMDYFSLVWGIPIFIIGLFILFNKREDIIERRKDLK